MRVTLQRLASLSHAHKRGRQGVPCCGYDGAEVADQPVGAAQKCVQLVGVGAADEQGEVQEGRAFQHRRQREPRVWGKLDCNRKNDQVGTAHIGALLQLERWQIGTQHDDGEASALESESTRSEPDLVAIAWSAGTQRNRPT